jgi:branched-chain amino acid transport system ATP-binding protein
VSLDVQEGTLAALIGPNGHGKTTLLRTISGLVTCRQGTISLGGRRIDRLRPDEIVSAGVVHVPQGDLLFPDMTVLENLRMGAYLPAAAALEKQRLEEVFTLLPKLKERRGQTASTLSGGERRMVGIGRGLMAGGSLLMLDEPSLGLAPIVIDQIYAVISALRASGRTIVIVEENATRIAGLADRLHLLDNGRFAWAGTGAELMSSPEILSAYLGG